MNKNEKKQMNMVYKLETTKHKRTSIQNVAEVLFWSSFGAPSITVNYDI